MKIAVCVKQIPEGSRRIDPETKRLDRSGEGALNPFDAHAVEEALRLKDAGGEGEIVLVSMGPAKAQDALRTALAMGAKSKPQETVSLADLGLDALESHTEVYALNDPPARGDSRKIDDDGNGAQAIVDFLAEKRLV